MLICLKLHSIEKPVTVECVTLNKLCIIMNCYDNITFYTKLESITNKIKNNR